MSLSNTKALGTRVLLNASQQNIKLRQLSTSFIKNGMRYICKKRTGDVAVYYVLANYSDAIICIEVFRVTVDPPNRFRFFFTEHFPTNAEVGKKFDSKCFCGKSKFELSEEHYQRLLDYSDND